MFIGMRPQGVTSFFSSANWDWRVMHWQALDCQQLLFELLLPGDRAIAGRGFDIEEDIARVLVSPKDTCILS